MEYKFVELLDARRQSGQWEQAVNAVAAEGYEWCDSFLVSDGLAYAVMRREVLNDPARVGG